MEEAARSQPVLGQDAVQLMDAAAESRDVRPQTLVLDADVEHLLTHGALLLESLLATPASCLAVLGPLVAVLCLNCRRLLLLLLTTTMMMMMMMMLIDVHCQTTG